MIKILTSFLFTFFLLCGQSQSFADQGKHKGKHKGAGHAKHVQGKHDQGKHKGWYKNKNHPKQAQVVREQPHVVREGSRGIREAVNAPVMAHRCPFSCATAGIPKSHCKDWREGSLCFVQATQRIVVPYRIVSAPTTVNRYYLVDPEIIEYPYASPGEIIGDKIGRAIDRAIP